MFAPLFGVAAESPGGRNHPLDRRARQGGELELALEPVAQLTSHRIRQGYERRPHIPPPVVTRPH